MKYLRVGFSGSREGMSPLQLAVVVEHMVLWAGMDRRIELHHGDCLGADAQIHAMALARDWPVIIHPPLDSRYRAFCEGAQEIRKPASFLDRNHNIVNETAKLVAGPNGFVEELRSGTWATVRYARSRNKSVLVVYPDGNPQFEEREFAHRIIPPIASKEVG